tara:strand:+ start:1440 stop:1694 length:255 start_codon:yes stop_codon:yes gene_type:complete
MNIFEERKLIQTEFDNSIESTENFQRAIKELKKENIPFRIIRRRLISEYAKKLYFTYSFIMDSILILLGILALFNLDKIAKVFA